MAIGGYDVFIVIDSDGDYAIGKDYDEALEAYDENIGGGAVRRIVKLTVHASMPVEAEETSVTIPDTAGTLIEAAAE